MEIIPFSDFPSFLQNLVLDNEVFNFKIHWNTRDEAWFIDILDATNEPIILGIKIVNEWELIQRFTNLNLPKGAFIVTDMVGENLDITRDDFELGNVVLTYFTEAEVNAAI